VIDRLLEVGGAADIEGRCRPSPINRRRCRDDRTADGSRRRRISSRCFRRTDRGARGPANSIGPCRTDGSWIGRLAGGRYYVAALADLAADDLADATPATRRGVREGHIGEGEQKTQGLRIGR
jgi:hypothetical protein